MGIVVAPALADRCAAIARPGRTYSDLGSREHGRRLLTRATFGLANSLAILNLTATGLGALAVGLPDASVIAELGDIVGGVAL